MPTTYPTNTLVQRSKTQNAGPSVASLTKTIPFDYVFEFKLKGKDPNSQDVVKLQDVVEISMQGIFVAVSLGYSFVLDESRVPREPFVPEKPASPPLILLSSSGEGQPTSFEIVGKRNTPMTVLMLRDFGKQRLVFGETTSFRPLNAALASGERDVVFTDDEGIANVTIPTDPERFSLTSTGIRVWDRSNNLVGELLQAPVVGPNPSTKTLPQISDHTIHIYDVFQRGVTACLVEGRTGRYFDLLTDTGSKTINIGEQGFVELKLLVRETDAGPLIRRQLSAGDLLIVDVADPIGGGEPASVFAVPSPKLSDLSFGALLRGFATANTLAVRPTTRLANLLKANPLAASVSSELLANAFEPAAGPEDVSFLYSIDIVSSGRELQNKPIHNIAGLGIANGDRPFRPFARPIAFEPRSVIRIQIEELSTLPGTLYIVLQGYKTLGTGRRPE